MSSDKRLYAEIQWAGFSFVISICVVVIWLYCPGSIILNLAYIIGLVSVFAFT